MCAFSCELTEIRSYPVSSKSPNLGFSCFSNLFEAFHKLWVAPKSRIFMFFKVFLSFSQVAGGPKFRNFKFF